MYCEPSIYVSRMMFGTMWHRPLSVILVLAVATSETVASSSQSPSQLNVSSQLEVALQSVSLYFNQSFQGAVTFAPPGGGVHAMVCKPCPRRPIFFFRV